MDQRHIVLVVLLPPYQQAAMAIEPTMCPLDNPSLGFMLAPAPLLHHAALRNMHGVTALKKAFAHIIEVITFVAAQVLRPLIIRCRSFNHDGVYHWHRHSLVMAVSSCHAQCQRCAALIGDDVAFRSRFGTIRWVFARLLAAQRSFRHTTIKGLPEPADTSLSVILSEQNAPQTSKDATPSPLLKTAMQGRTAAEFLWRIFPLAACAQDIEDAIEDDPEGDDRTPLGAKLLFFTQQWFDLFPQIIGNMPYCFQSAFASHCFVPSKQNIQVQ